MQNVEKASCHLDKIMENAISPGSQINNVYKIACCVLAAQLKLTLDNFRSMSAHVLQYQLNRKMIFGWVLVMF